MQLRFPGMALGAGAIADIFGQPSPAPGLLHSEGNPTTLAPARSQAPPGRRADQDKANRTYYEFRHFSHLYVKV